MKKPTTSNSNLIKGNFTAIPNWYWECGLTLIEVNIVARIASWQRDGKEFYESAEKLSKLFNVSYSTMKRSFNKLVEDGVIKRNGKHKRMWKYVINETKLNTLKKDMVHPDQNNERYGSQGAILSTTMNHYNTTKTSNKTSFREGENEETFSLPNQPDPKPEILLDQIAQLAKEIDIN